MTRIVTGLFDRHRTVDLVVEHLVQEFAVPRECIQVHAADTASGEEARSPQDEDQEACLQDLGLPAEAARACDEGMRRGGILVAAWVEDGRADHALAAYREYGATEAAAHAAVGAAPVRDPERQVRREAYLLWEREGRPEGRDQEFWHRARRTIEGDDSPAARAPQEFAGETGAAPLPEREASPER